MTVFDSVATTLTLDGVCAVLAVLLGAWLRAALREGRITASGVS